MDYSQLSDQEINIQVARIMHPEREVIESKSRPPSACVIGHLPSKWLDYCNNAADAWPIITENRIAIIPDTAAGEWVAFNEYTLYEGDWMFAIDPTHHSNGKNPLRCAMECFLMMQGAKHA